MIIFGLLMVALMILLTLGLGIGGLVLLVFGDIIVFGFIIWVIVQMFRRKKER